MGIGGFRIGPHASNLDYEIVAGLDGVGATGSSTSFGLDTSYPLIRSRFQNLSFLLSLDDSRYENENTISSPSGETSSTSTYKVSSVNMTLNGYVIDGAGGGGVNQAALIFTAGNAKKTDESAEPLLAEGGFKKARYSINRQQHITDWLELHGSLVGQLASGNLTSSEKFTLGGASGVRAYTSTDGTGDLGQLLTLEVRVSLPYHLHVTAFYDMGGVTVDKKPRPSALISTSTPPPNHYTLKGAGLSTSWTSDSGFNLKATWAARIGSNPLLATATGVNDDSSDKNRIWLQASMKF